MIGMDKNFSISFLSNDMFKKKIVILLDGGTSKTYHMGIDI
jgi:hypothetical protein